MRLGIVGGGVVGHATARCFVEHHEVRVADSLKERATHGLGEVLDSDIVFLCLPTPAKEKGGLDTRHVTAFFDALPPKKRDACFVLRSTVPVGTTAGLRLEYGLTNIVHSPEFLTARCSVLDAQIPSRNVVGGVWCKCKTELVSLYQKRFPGIPVLVMDSGESEAVKLFQNAFFAVKVSFWNEVRSLADKLNLNWDHVLKGILADGRITPSHTLVPGPDGLRGFGGACLPGWYCVGLEDGSRITLQTLKQQFDAGSRPYIRSTDGQCRVTDFKPVLDVTEREYEGDLIEFETDTGIFACTPDHLMPILRGGVLSVIKAQDVLITDEIITDAELYRGDLSSVRKEETVTV